MKSIKWLISLADGKPLLFLVAILLIACSFLVSHSVKLQNKIDDSVSDRMRIQIECDRKMDTMRAYFARKEDEFHAEVKANLHSIIEDYKKQLQEQKNINDEMNSAIIRNQRLINSTSKKIKNLQ